MTNGMPFKWKIEIKIVKQKMIAFRNSSSKNNNKRLLTLFNVSWRYHILIK